MVCKPLPLIVGCLGLALVAHAFAAPAELEGSSGKTSDVIAPAAPPTPGTPAPSWQKPAAPIDVTSPAPVRAPVPASKKGELPEVSTRQQPAKPANPTPVKKLSAREEIDLVKKRPLAFYIARGGTNVCGEGCDTWIAAQGFFDNGAADRFRRLLKKLGQRKLPIYFDSTGGNGRTAVAIGRLMRAMHMTAGVARTVPRECRSANLPDMACHELMLSGRELEATINEYNGVCASACVYALIGASTRHVAPGVPLGIHSARQMLFYGDGRIEIGSAASARASLARMRAYIVEMGVDPALLDAAEAISHDQIRILTREEIVHFKIDTREFFETAWVSGKSETGLASLFKATFQKWQAENSDYYEYIERLVLVSCIQRPGSYTVAYTWISDTDNPENMGMIRLEFGSRRPVLLAPMQTRSNGRLKLRAELISIDRLTDAANLPHILVVEDSNRASRQFKLSTAGLSDGLTELTNRCSDK